MHVWALGLSCETRAAPPDRAAGASHYENSKRAYLNVPALQTPSKFHERTPRERRKNEISGGREKKKREILGPPPFGPHPSAPTLRAPTPPGSPSGPHPSGPPPLRAPTPPGPHPFEPPPKTKLAKCGLAKFGQQKLAKFGQIRFGQMRPNKDGQIRFGQMRSWPPSCHGSNQKLLI